MGAGTVGSFFLRLTCPRLNLTQFQGTDKGWHFVLLRRCGLNSHKICEGDDGFFFLLSLFYAKVYGKRQLVVTLIFARGATTGNHKQAPFPSQQIVIFFSCLPKRVADTEKVVGGGERKGCSNLVVTSKNILLLLLRHSICCYFCLSGDQKSVAQFFGGESTSIKIILSVILFWKKHYLK